ncbi:hypothetical protein AAFF_G00184490 [Aldrovandia affinis]|uniref:Integrase zinc-binding domain-containing protein n=1 Tax=Aldrovandia affinis TaxID=143900 RepID=A0AAD7W6G8_9TELE|nr:hypothetical protein AAFF_G00184490 [Aldrovandia affinis]
MGHLGVERTTDLLQDRFYWPKMAWDAEKYVKNCGECVTRKIPCKKAAPLHQIVSRGPMDLVCIDFLSMEPDSKGISNVLVVTDHFTRILTIPTDVRQRSQTASGSLFGTSPDGTGDRHHSQYVEKLKGDLQEAYQLASQAADKTHQRNKRAYDQRVSFQAIDTGDRVLLKNLGLRDREWERTHRSYKDYMDKLLQRRTYDEPVTAGSSEEEHEPSVQDPSEEEEVSIREEDNKVSVCEKSWTRRNIKVVILMTEVRKRVSQKMMRIVTTPLTLAALNLS